MTLDNGLDSDKTGCLYLVVTACSAMEPPKPEMGGMLEKNGGHENRDVSWQLQTKLFGAEKTR